MKKIKFNTIFECCNCKQKYIGYRKNQCPLCGCTLVNKKDEKIVTFVKGKINNEYSN